MTIRKLLLLIATLLAGNFAAARPKMRVERPDGKSVVFILDNNQRPGTTTVFLKIKETMNCNVSNETRRYFVTAPTARLLTLKPTDPTRGIGYNYSWYHVPGRVDPKFDSTFVYRMPCRTDRPVRINDTIYIQNRRTKALEKRHSGTTFYLEEGDTVYAMRRGIVTEIELPKPSEQPPAKGRFFSKRVQITVEHPDGTIAEYINFDPDHLLVKAGQRVLPGTPLGLVGSYDGKDRPVSVRLLWYATNPSKKPNAKPFVTHLYAPYLATTEGILIPRPWKLYTAVETPELVEREMTKKEIKKYRAGNKK